MRSALRSAIVAGLTVSLGLVGMGCVSKAVAAIPTAASTQSIDVGRSAILSASDGGSSARVTLTVGRVSPDSAAMNYYRDPRVYRPRTTMTGLDISVSGRTVSVPLSAIADLIDIHGASLRADQGGYALELTGGDRSESYRVELHFNSSIVYRRMLKPSGTEQWSERTDYRIVEID